MEKQFYTVKELSELMPIGTTKLYNLVHSEGFPSIIISRKILIPIDEFNKWVRNFSGKKINL